MNPNHQLTIYTDGGSRGNPGPAAYAYVIQRDGESDIEEKVYLGHTTNNIAEYTGMVKALEHARELGARRVTIFSDSELMVKQMNGEYRVKNAGLLPLYEEATRLCKAFDAVTFRHVRREYNKQADRLCNEAMDNPRDSEARIPDVAPPPVAAAPVEEDVHTKAVARLREAARSWTAGATQPDAAQVWDELWEMLVAAKVVRKMMRQAPGRKARG